MKQRLQLSQFIRRTSITEGVDETALPINPGTKILYDGSVLQAVSQATNGWYWTVVGGKKIFEGSKLYLFDDPIYSLPRDNSKVASFIAPKNISKSTDKIKFPKGINTLEQLFGAALISNTRLKEYESLIARNPEVAARYAAKFDFRFDKYGAEDRIKTNPEAASLYAIKVLKHRWPEAEETIKKDSRAWNRYAYNFNI